MDKLLLFFRSGKLLHSYGQFELFLGDLPLSTYSNGNFFHRQVRLPNGTPIKDGDFPYLK